MNVKEQMLKAKNLIQQRQYDEARAILKTIDHEKARQWESKLPKPERRVNPIWPILFTLIVLAGGGYLAITFITQMNTSRDLGTASARVAVHCVEVNSEDVVLRGMPEIDCGAWSDNVITGNDLALLACQRLHPVDDNAFIQCLDKSGMLIDL